MTFNYASGINDDISLLSSLPDTTGTLESYSYLGLGTVVIRSHPQPANHVASLRRQPGEAGISGLTTPVYDANGNMTTDQTGKQFVYDAWNRMVRVKDSGGTTLETFSYDGRNHRVTNTVGSTTTNLYYSNQWQVLEEQVSGTDVNRYVWSPVYVNAMVLRDRDTDSNGALDERLWPTEDANWDVMALVNPSGSVVERYTYDPYGTVMVFTEAFAPILSSTVDQKFLYETSSFDKISALDYFRQREYSFATNQWTQTDPVLYNANELNLYRFVKGRPICRVDPFGTEDKPPLSWSGAIDYKDVTQGSQDDCWLISSIVALAYHRPDEIKEMIRHYAGGFSKAEGPKHYVCFPGMRCVCVVDDGKGARPDWARLIELAAAKFINTKDENVGSFGYGIQLLTGNTRSSTLNATGLFGFRNWAHADPTPKVMIAGTGGSTVTLNYIRPGHVYAVLSYNARTDMFLMRDPLGNLPQPAGSQAGTGPGEFYLSWRNLNQNYDGIAKED